jgi:hypothetical protein
MAYPHSGTAGSMKSPAPLEGDAIATGKGFTTDTEARRRNGWTREARHFSLLRVSVANCFRIFRVLSPDYRSSQTVPKSWLR